eukprot:m.292773 g.292773  ORF g.292773 m.292773 type:complete len:64 (+) comp15845_c2_seq1:1903-2094(+)
MIPCVSFLVVILVRVDLLFGLFSWFALALQLLSSISCLLLLRCCLLHPLLPSPITTLLVSSSS